MALAGMTGCVRLPLEPIVPYVRQPEDVIPGRPQFYATAMTLGGYANPILVESHMGRPTKIEGNDKHPASLGGTDIFAQAHVLGMYDPDRSQSVTSMGDQRSWQSFISADSRAAQCAEGVAGRGHPHSDADHFFAHAGRSAAQLPEDLSAGQVACVRAGQSRQRARRREAGLRPAGRDALRFRKGRRNRFARRRLPVCGFSGQRPLHPRLRQAPQSRRQHEPAVRDREHADHDGGEGGSSTAGASGDALRQCACVRASFASAWRHDVSVHRAMEAEVSCDAVDRRFAVAPAGRA